MTMLNAALQLATVAHNGQWREDQVTGELQLALTLQSLLALSQTLIKTSRAGLS